MFVLEENGEILASVILNSKANESYRLVNWSREVPDEKVLIIHVLAVSPKHAGKGLGTKMMQYILDYAKEIRMQAVRLDVISNNSSAEHLYQKMGFRFVQTQRLYYEVTGEKILICMNIIYSGQLFLPKDFDEPCRGCWSCFKFSHNSLEFPHTTHTVQ